MKTTYYRFASSGLALALLLTVSVNLHAGEEEEPVIVKATMGFGSIIRPEHWCAMSVRIDNPGTELDAQFAVEIKSTTGGPTRVFTRPVYLPAWSSREFTMPIRYEGELSPPPRGNKKEGEKDDKKSSMVSFEVRLSRDGIILTGDVFYCAPRDSSFYYVASINRDGGNLQSLMGEYLKKNGSEITCVSWQVRNVPQRPEELLSADAIVLGDIGPDSLNDLQQKAIVDWVKTGGLLLFSPGLDPGRYSGTILEEILPVRVTGLRRVNRIPCLDRFGEPLRTEGDTTVSVLESVVLRGDVLLSDGDLPIAVLSRTGQGKVIYFAPNIIDPALNAWPGIKKLIPFLIDRPSDMFPDEQWLLAASSDKILDSFAGLTVPRKSSVIIYMIVVIIALCAPPYILRRSSREKVGWAISLSLCLIFTLGAYVTAKGMKGINNVSVNEVYILKIISGESEGKLTGFAGVIAPRRTYFDIVPVLPGMVFGPTKSPGKGVPAMLEYRCEDTAAMTNFQVNENSMRGFSFSGFTDINGSVEGSCVFTGDGLVVRLKNGLPGALEDGFLKFNRLVLNMPEVPPGAEVKVVFGRASGPAHVPSYTAKTLSGREGVVRTQLRKCFFPNPISDLGPAGSRGMIGGHLKKARYSGAAIFGWSRTSLRAFEVSEAEELRAVGLIATRVGTQREGSRVLIPQGVCERRMGSKMMLFEHGSTLIPGFFPTNFEAEFVLPDVCKGMEADQLRVFWDFQSKNITAKIEVGRGPKGKVQYEDVGQDNVIDVPEPNRYINGKSNSVFVRITMKAPTVAEGEILLVDSSWQLWGLDVEIEGRIND